ncbi:MAG: hypothetical protein GXN99_01960 [Candidatus Nanohaloarchaeota archaeon]|nr:hypothetical protein [Candidatus Nanohaloarchaeota archaeon]
MVVLSQEKMGEVKGAENQKTTNEVYQSSVASFYSPSKVFKLLVNLAGEDGEEKWNAPSKYEAAINGILAGNKKYLDAVKAQLKNEADPYDPHDFNVSYAVADALEEAKLKSWEDRLKSLEKLTDLYKFFMNANLRKEIKEGIKESLIYANKLIDVMKEMYEANKQNREDANLRKLKMLGDRELLKTYYSLKKRIIPAFSSIYGEVYAQEDPAEYGDDASPHHQETEETNLSNEAETKKEDGNGNGTGSNGNNLENFPIYQIAAKIAKYAEDKTIPADEGIVQLTNKYINTLNDSEKEALKKLMEGLEKGSKEQAYQGLKELFKALYDTYQQNKTTERKDAVRFLSAIAYSLEYAAGKFRPSDSQFKIYNLLVREGVINDEDITNLYKYKKNTSFQEIFNELSGEDEREYYNTYTTLLKSNLTNALKEAIESTSTGEAQIVEDVNDSGIEENNEEIEEETNLDRQPDTSDGEENVENNEKEMYDGRSNNSNGGSGSGNDDENDKKGFLSAVWEKIKNNPGKSALFSLALLALAGGFGTYKHFSNKQAEVHKYLNNPKKIEIFASNESDFQKFINSLIPQQEWEEVLSKNFDKINKNPNPQRVIELLNEAGYKVKRVVKAKIGNSEVWWLKGKTEKTYYKDPDMRKNMLEEYRKLLELNTGYAVFEVKTPQYEGIVAIPTAPYLKGDNSKPIIWLASIGENENHESITKIKKSQPTYISKKEVKKPVVQKTQVKSSSQDQNVCKEKSGFFGNLGNAWDKLFNPEKNYDPFSLP